ncbi:hypothetical protein FW778_18365 [Ginsengibacter hankyongi]|uniref:Threonine/homoserine/homoserine lactone efflux protein n=1 Tax=Ginsengibacter hankyongi TaxID=2607284 RepID=A0A5J5IGZ3_9BACT|nr:LysE family transporter [Ginsengibacter hankyongi]KAA9036581.1 hypothetical protein FW778_18365 [Ginsengibacter hankyongi]
MTTILSSFIFGITLAISIGPIAMLIINRSINCRLQAGILTGLAAAFADFTYCIISFVAGAAISALLIHYEVLLKDFASITLILFGGWMLLNAIKSGDNVVNNSGSSCNKPFISTYALTMANPLTIVAFSGFAAQSAVRSFNVIVFSSIALFAGSFLIQVSLALFGTALKKFISNRSIVFFLNIINSSSIIGMGLLKLF